MGTTITVGLCAHGIDFSQNCQQCGRYTYYPYTTTIWTLSPSLENAALLEILEELKAIRRWVERTNTGS